MIGSWISKKIERQIKAVAKAVPFKPNNLTILGLVLIIFAVPFIFFGRHWIAGALILLAGIFDVLDGAKARMEGTASAFGSFLDSVTDRVSDSLIFIALTGYFYFVEDATGGFITVWALTLSFMISYLRAKAESLGAECKVGIIERFERIVLVLLAFFTGMLTLFLLILVTLSVITVIQRFAHTYKQLSEH